MAFAPVFASFRALLGDELYDLAQRRSDEGQAGLLDSLLESGSEWGVYVAVLDDTIVGFVSVLANHETLLGEIGLNAVDPDFGNRGLGTRMYEFALAQLRDIGMRAAIVGTGGDASHAPARRAYSKAGFRHAIPSVWMYQQLS